ncbi:MAG: chitobiase/beta-hexosaminidase C-terminal domain-containing protein [Flavobacteriaceae bacterium]
MKAFYLKQFFRSSVMTLFLCFGLTSGWAQYTGVGTFTKVTSEAELTDGYYVVTNETDAFAMNNTHTTFFGHTAVTPSSGELMNPDASIVWKIETNGSGKTIYNEVIEKYVGWISGNAASAEDAPADTNRWTFSYADSKWTVNNVATPVRQLSYNWGSPRFAAYGNNNQQELQLYKLGEIPTDPVLNASETEITGLGYMEGNTPASQSFSLNGLNLDPANGNITVTAPANFQVSTDDVSFNNSLNIAYTDGALAATDVYVRLNESLMVGAYNGDIEISGGGVTNVTVSVEGIVTEFVNICGEEDFSNIPTNSPTSYNTRTWTGNNDVEWTVDDARTDQTIDGEAILLRASTLTNTTPISGGVGTISFDYKRTFANNSTLKVFVNGTQYGGDITVSEETPTNFSTQVNVSGDITIEIVNTGQRTTIDNLTWTCYSAGPPTQVATPTFMVTGEANGVDTYWNTASITLETTTDGATIYYTTNGDDPTTSSTLYTGVFVASSTTTIKAFAVADDLDDSAIAEKTITITEPATTTIPYSEAFSNTLGDWISYTNSGVNWVAGSAGVSVNGYNSQSELVWLLSPKFLSIEVNSLLSFDHASQFTNGNDLEIRYSTDYAGYGDPTAANWTTLQAIASVSNGSVTDLAIPASGDIHIAFVYTDISSPYAQWTVSNFSIEEPSTDPVLSASETELTGFAYGLGSGPSASQSFVLSGENLDGSEDVTLLADTGFEISLDDTSFDNELVLTDYEGENTTIYVRLASGLALGAHSGVILIDGYGAEEEVSISGSVLAVPVVTEASDLTAQVDVAYSYQIIASDEPFSYVISSEALPAGLSLDTETGFISGTPTVAGEFIFGVEATNNIGTSEEGVFILTVAKGVQTVDGLGNVDTYLGDADITLPTITDQGFTLVYEVEPNAVASISGNTISFTGLGSIDFIAYTEDEDDNYEDYLEIFTITVTEAPETPKVIISQVYEGASNNKWIELANVGDTTIDLSQVKIAIWSIGGSAGNGDTSEVPTTTTLSGSLIPGATFLIRNANASATVPHNPMPTADLSGTAQTNFNGNDALALMDLDDNIIDAFGDGINNLDKSFHRKAGVLNPNSSFTLSEWEERTLADIAAADDTMTEYIGTHIYGVTAVVWTIDNQWSGTPSITEDVVIEGDLIVTDLNSFEAKTLTVNGSLTIEAEGWVTIAENITNNGTFVVESGANLIQLSANTGDNVGAISVHRNSSLIKHLDYTLWSSPVAGQGLQAFSPLTLWYRIYTYDTTLDEWESVFSSQEDNDVNFEQAIGYMFRAPNDFETTPYIYDGTFTGIPQSGNVTVTFGTTGTYQGVGNPYPSNIKVEGADGFWNENPNTGTLYFWTNVNPWDNQDEDYTGNNWSTYNKVGGVGVANPADNDAKLANGIIPVGQGFMVETDGLITDVTFTNSMRATDEGVFFKVADAEKNRLWLSLSQDNNIFNQLLVGYLEGATQGFDFGFDGKIFNYTGSALYSLIDNNEGSYTIQGRSLPFDDNDVVALGFRASNQGTFTISLTDFDGLFTESQDIFLRDNLTQNEQNLKTGNYTFVSGEGTFDNRFEIVYKESGDLSTTNPNLNNNWLVYTKDRKFQIETQGFEIKEVVVYDMLGRVVYQKQANGTSHTTSDFRANGVLVVKVITTDNQILTKKTTI